MNKQIEEMAWDLCDIPKHPNIKSCEQCGNKHCLAMYYAKRACNNGYRKASDVAREILTDRHLIDILYRSCGAGGKCGIARIEELKERYGVKKDVPVL